MTSTAIAYVDGGGRRQTMMMRARRMQRISGGCFGVAELTGEDCVKLIGRRLATRPLSYGGRRTAQMRTLYAFNGHRIWLLDSLVHERRLSDAGLVAVIMPRWVADLWEASCV